MQYTCQLSTDTINANKSVGNWVVLVGVFMVICYQTIIFRTKRKLSEDQQKFDTNVCSVGDFSVVLTLSENQRRIFKAKTLLDGSKTNRFANFKLHLKQELEKIVN